MISILIKNSIHLNKCKKLLNINDRFINNYYKNNVVKTFRTERNIKTSLNNSIVNRFQFLKSKVFLGSVYAIGGTITFFSVATIFTYEKARKLRRNYLFGLNNYSRNQISKLWNNLKENQKFFCVIATLNAMVFCAWRIPSLSPYMYKYFVLGLSQSNTFLPMLLSTFSHHNFGHMFLNMYCLYTFSNISTYMFGKEGLTAFYLSSALFSSLASLVLKSYFASTSFSLGASGAILGVIAASCILNPDMNISIIFLPFVSTTATNCLYGIIAIDVAGILLKWKFMDHAGHLGGTLFGVWYVNYGCKIINNYCKKFVKLYNTIRKN